MEIIWLDTAVDEFEEAIDWIRARNDEAADNIANLALVQIDQLHSYPQIGRIGRNKNTRELVITKTNFIAVYRIQPTLRRIEILSFKHDAMQWPTKF